MWLCKLEASVSSVESFLSVKAQSTSHSATIFWLARLIRLLRPIPPTPTHAIFSMSLGGVNPRPRTCLGTIVTAALATAAFSIKLRREISFFSDIRLPPVGHLARYDFGRNCQL